jgi:hypothetical protein
MEVAEVVTHPEPTQATADPIAELAETLQDLRTRLDSLIDSREPAPAGSACLVQLRRYLLVDLIPILHGLQLRVHPQLRRAAVGSGRRSAAEHARLLRLTERVVAFAAVNDSGSATPAELTVVTRELALLADRHLSREQRTLPTLLKLFPPAQVRRLLDAAIRTATTVRLAPHLDLDPSLL